MSYSKLSDFRSYTKTRSIRDAGFYHKENAGIAKEIESRLDAKIAKFDELYPDFDDAYKKSMENNYAVYP